MQSGFVDGNNEDHKVLLAHLLEEVNKLEVNTFIAKLKIAIKCGVQIYRFVSILGNYCIYFFIIIQIEFMFLISMREFASRHIV